MAVFIELTTDAFSDVLAAQAQSTQGGNRTSGAGRTSARRPTRGLEIKDDTYAILKLIRVDGREIPLIDSSSPTGQSQNGYSNFILQSVQEARMEKYQIVETFGESYIFMFGESPRFIDVMATIINSNDFNWEAEWWENYNQYLRGTKSVELAARTYMFYDDNIVEGYVLMAQAAKLADQPLQLQLTFRMFITNYQNISFIGDPNFPVRASVNLPPDVSLTDGDVGGTLIERYRNAARDVITQSGGDPAADTVSKLIAAGKPAGSSISQLLRMASPSFGVSPDTWAAIENLEVAGSPLADQLRELAERTGKPIRGLIADNTDEYVGAGPQPPDPFDTNGPNSTISQLTRSQQESDDLFRDSINFLACYGAYINSPKIFAGIGLGVNFGNAPGSAASFRPTAQPAFGFGVTEQVGYNTNTSNSLKTFAKDSLGAVFGNVRAQVGVFATTTPDPRNQYSQGGGDPGYGYPSNFATGPGFGVPGFGDMGGLGFGGALGATGDPGYRDPNKFTFAGVSDQRSAFNRFLLPKTNPTVLGAGFGFGTVPGLGGGIGTAPGASVAGLSGGAAIQIGGRPSPFSMVALDGVLDDTGNARQDPAQVSSILARSRIGFTNPNPFGVHCPVPGIGIRLGVGVGAGASIAAGVRTFL